MVVWYRTGGEGCWISFRTIQRDFHHHPHRPVGILLLLLRDHPLKTKTKKKKKKFGRYGSVCGRRKKKRPNWHWRLPQRTTATPQRSECTPFPLPHTTTTMWILPAPPPLPPSTRMGMRSIPPPQGLVVPRPYRTSPSRRRPPHLILLPPWYRPLTCSRCYTCEIPLCCSPSTRFSIACGGGHGRKRRRWRGTSSAAAPPPPPLLLLLLCVFLLLGFKWAGEKWRKWGALMALDSAPPIACSTNRAIDTLASCRCHTSPRLLRCPWIRFLPSTTIGRGGTLTITSCPIRFFAFSGAVPPKSRSPTRRSRPVVWGRGRQKTVVVEEKRRGHRHLACPARRRRRRRPRFFARSSTKTLVCRPPCGCGVACPQRRRLQGPFPLTRSKRTIFCRIPNNNTSSPPQP